MRMSGFIFLIDTFVAVVFPPLPLVKSVISEWDEGGSAFGNNFSSQDFHVIYAEGKYRLEVVVWVA